MKEIEERRERRLEQDGFDVLEHSDCTSEIAEQLGLKREWDFLVNGGEQRPKIVDVMNTNPKLRKEMIDEADQFSDRGAK
jgi:hypothetical protein